MKFPFPRYLLLFEMQRVMERARVTGAPLIPLPLRERAG
jgi:hypothetical protein